MPLQDTAGTLFVFELFNILEILYNVIIPRMKGIIEWILQQR